MDAPRVLRHLLRGSAAAATECSAHKLDPPDSDTEEPEAHRQRLM